MKHIKLFENFNEADNTALAAEVMKVATPEQKVVLEDFQSGTEFFFLGILSRNKKPVTPELIDDALQLMVNDVEGDTSQLDDEHAKYAESKGWLKDF